jgi:hypothetical protein
MRFLAVCILFFLPAQLLGQPDSDPGVQKIVQDQLYPRWSARLYAGDAWISNKESYKLFNMARSYSNTLPNNNSLTKFPIHSSLHNETQSLPLVGVYGGSGYYYFDKKRRWGVSLGIQYSKDTGYLKIDTFYLQYCDTDALSRTYRQELSTSKSGIIERVGYRSLSFPFSLRYKLQFPNSRFGIFGECGGTVGFQKTYYTANTSFNYEAVYKLVNQRWVYDTALQVSEINNTQIILTEKFITYHNPALTQSIDKYFDDLRNGPNKFNVGLEKQISDKSGKVGNVFTYGYFGKLGLSLMHSRNLVYQLEGFFSHRVYKKEVTSYKVTDGIGSYSSLLNGIEKSTKNSWGIQFAVEIFFGRNHDLDHDGVSDDYDFVPRYRGPNAFSGAPDNDYDGIPDIFDRCPDLPGPACTMGCPDKDEDCVADIEEKEQCKNEVGVESNWGCPVGGFKPPASVRNIYIKSYAVINFVKDSSVLDEKGRNALQKIATSIHHSHATIFILPSTGGIIQDKSDEGLAPSRADSIMRYLVDSAGVSRYKITIGNHGFIDTNNVVSHIYFGEGLLTEVVKLAPPSVQTDKARPTNEVAPKQDSTKPWHSGTIDAIMHPHDDDKSTKWGDDLPIDKALQTGKGIDSAAPGKNTNSGYAIDNVTEVLVEIIDTNDNTQESFKWEVPLRLDICQGGCGATLKGYLSEIGCPTLGGQLSKNKWSCGNEKMVVFHDIILSKEATEILKK